MPIRRGEESQEIQHKLAVMFYHKDLKNKYQRRWMDKCVSSIENQSYKDYDVFELNYSSTNTDTLTDLIDRATAFPNKHFIIYKPLNNHVDAMNYLLDYIFTKHSYTAVANTNVDDFYHSNRLVKQLEEIKNGWELVSTNFLHIRENEKLQDQIIHACKFDQLNIKEELNKDNNILCHPSIMYSKTFYEKFGPSPYKGSPPTEDIDLWKYAINNGAKMFIIPEYLCYYRRHSAQICK